MTDEAANFERVAEAFDRQSPVFDDYEERNAGVIWMRSVIHEHMDKYVHEGERLLDLNAGTGTDAIHFAHKGLSVHALDISGGMLEKLRGKAARGCVSERISIGHQSFADLSGFGDRQFNHVFSNFGGLNCTDNPSGVISQFSRILVPGGTVTLVVMPPVCPWELAAIIKGNFRLAFRRLRKGGTRANVEGVMFKTYYHSPARLLRSFGNAYSLAELRGLCAIVPPPNFDRMASRHPKLFRKLTVLDNRLCTHIPFTSWADHYILTMRYNP